VVHLAGFPQEEDRIKVILDDQRAPWLPDRLR